MADFSISDAALTGFRVVRERPRAVAVWALIQLAFSIAASIILIGLGGPSLIRLQQAGPGAMMDPQAALGIFARLGPMYLALLVLSLLVSAILYAAMNRAVLTPGADRFGYVRLGIDEIRQFQLLVLATIVGLTAYLMLAVAAVLIGIALAGILKSPGPLPLALGAVPAVCVLVFLAVRLSLASAQTFAAGRVDLFGSWALTQGRFWPIFGAYAIAFAFGIVVALLGFLIVFGIVALVGGPATLSAGADMSSIAAFFTPGRIVETLLRALVAALVLPLLGTPAPAIYRRLTGSAAA
ncbi:MAG: hypothetical protein ABI376_06725 [Caulobacteraceae bacterium]